MNWFNSKPKPPRSYRLYEVKRSNYPKIQDEVITLTKSAISKNKLQKYTKLEKDTRGDSIIFIHFDKVLYAKDNGIKPEEDEYGDETRDLASRAMSPVIDSLQQAGYNTEVDGDVGNDDVYWIESMTTEKYAMFNETAYRRAGSVNYINFLTECGVLVDRGFMLTMNEANQVQVSEDVLTGMMKFITDKYNSMDFGEIEKSAGDITRFKYTGVIRQNAEMLKNIYSNCDDIGAKKYLQVTDAVMSTLNHLETRRISYSNLYKSGNGLIQLLYTSEVAACIYSIGILVSNTIRFVTTEQNTDCQVLYDEIPGSAKNVHIKNILSVANSIPEFNKLLDSYERNARGPMRESIEAIGVGLAIAAGVIYMIPKILIIIREIIYSVYFMRIKVADMLAVQIELVNTNIEALERRGGKKSVIAKQAKVVKTLENWKNKIAVKVDTVNSMVTAQKRKEVQSLRVEPNSPIASAPDQFNPNDLMI